MQISRRSALAFGLACAFAAGAHAQAWPGKPIRLIVPFTPGGGTDSIARELANTMGNYGYQWVIENRPGSGGNLGVDAAAKSPADGYAFALGQTSNLAINSTLYSKMPYDAVKDLTPVSMVASSPLAIVVGAESPFKTMADVVKAAKANPGAVNYATSGNGTVSHLAMESFQRAAGIKMTHIPYKGAAQGLTDVIGGRVELYVSSVPTLIGHVKQGKMRALAVTSLKRNEDLAQVPTIAEGGYPGFEAVTWFGVVGPANVPKDIVTKFNADINKALKDPTLKKKLADQGADVDGGTPEEFARRIREETARWGVIVKESGAKLD